MARVYAVHDPTETGDPGYVAGLREAVRAGVEYGLRGLEVGEEPPPEPTVLLAQARRAARTGISLDTVLRRYCAGHALLGELLASEAMRDGALATKEFQRASRAEAEIFDRLLGAVTDAYGEASSCRPGSSEERLAGRVRKLLAGELLDAPELHYQLKGWHLASVAQGSGAAEQLRSLAAAMERGALIVEGEEDFFWAWFGGQNRLDAAEALAIAESHWPPEQPLSLGEAGEGLAGWRRSHRQAKAAMPIATQGKTNCVRYADVALLASALSDEVLADTLRETYLTPLVLLEREGGTMSRRILAAYLATGHNASSTAAVLGVHRRTVSTRLRAIEERIGAPVDSCGPELQTALGLGEIAY